MFEPSEGNSQPPARKVGRCCWAAALMLPRTFFPIRPYCRYTVAGPDWRVRRGGGGRRPAWQTRRASAKPFTLPRTFLPMPVTVHACVQVLSEFTTSRARDQELEVSSRAQSVPSAVIAAAERLKRVAANGGASSVSGTQSDSSAQFSASLPSNSSCSLPGNLGPPSRFARLGEANLKASNQAWQVRAVRFP